MKNIDYEIQNRETDVRFPFRLFFNRGEPSHNHCHREVEFLFVLNNNMTLYLNGKSHVLEKDSIALISPGDIHGVEGSEHIRLVLQFRVDLLEGKYIEKDEIYSIYEKLHTLERLSSHWPREAQNKISGILMELSAISDAQDPCQRIKILYLVYKLIYTCLTEIPASSQLPMPSHMIYKNKAMQNLEKAFIYINKNYGRKITLEEISSLFHYSPEYFSRLWKKYTGITFHRYLNEYRITQAIMLLKDTELSISDICYRSGFESIKTFNRVFKSVTGKNPSSYRQLELAKSKVSPVLPNEFIVSHE